jgi:hypothetical protein
VAKYGPAPSAEEIDENRREMLTGFARDSMNFLAAADTHVAVWYLFYDPRLSIKASAYSEKAAAAGAAIAISRSAL